MYTFVYGLGCEVATTDNQSLKRIKMRSKKELYEIILDEYNSHESSSYICCFIRYMWDESKITHDEYKFIIDDFERNEPTSELHTEFYHHELHINSNAWWIMGTTKSVRIKAIQVRSTFLEKMVRINS